MTKLTGLFSAVATSEAHQKELITNMSEQIDEGNIQTLEWLKGLIKEYQANGIVKHMKDISKRQKELSTHEEHIRKCYGSVEALYTLVNGRK